MRMVLLVGSGRNAVDAKHWEKPKNMKIVCIHNAWRIRSTINPEVWFQIESDWDYLLYSDDWPLDRRPASLNRTQFMVGTSHYVPAMSECGGIVFCGATMAYAAAYWCLRSLHPDVIGIIGCDMDYGAADGKTHFYGVGTPDPLRQDITLRNLYAKSARLLYFALRQGCYIFNLSQAPFSRLMYERATIDELRAFGRPELLRVLARMFIGTRMKNARRVARKALRKECSAPFDPHANNYGAFIHSIEPDLIDLIDNYWQEFGRDAERSLFLSAYALEQPAEQKAEHPCSSRQQGE